MEKMMLAEAALFMSAEPLTIDQLGKIMGTDSLGKTLRELDALVVDFNERSSSLEIVKTTDGRYRMQVRHPYISKVKDLAITTDLPKGVLRTLAIIAFKQPIKQSIVVKMRGNKAYDHIAQLVEEGFVKKIREGNTYILEPTKKFIDYFGEPIRDTEFVPKSSQMILGEGQDVPEASAETETPEPTETPQETEPAEIPQETEVPESLEHIAEELDEL